MGLFMIQIDHLLAGDYMGGAPRLEERFLDSGVSDSDLEIECFDGRDDSPVKRVGLPASSSGHKDKQSVRDHQNQRISIVSCGARNFGLTHAAKRNKEEFRTYVWLTQGADLHRDKNVHVDFSDPGIKDFSWTTSRVAIQTCGATIARCYSSTV